MATATDLRVSLLDAARAIAPEVRAVRDEIENERQMPLPLVQAMQEAGFFRLLVPREIGGFAEHPLTAFLVIEEIARADGSAGWNLMIGVEEGMFSSFLPQETAREIWSLNPNAILGGSATPNGRAVAVEGGYRVTGQWPFASGCQHCTWLAGNSILLTGDTPIREEDGSARVRWLLFPAEQAEIIDTWNVAGMRGTGSHDIAVSDLFVPEGRVFAPYGGTPWPAGGLYEFPYRSIVGITLASVATGIARAAIDALVDLAAGKTPVGSRVLLRERAAVQADVARAEAMLRSARCFLFEAVEEAWEAAQRGPLSLEQRALVRLAAINAVSSATHAVDLMYNAGGATSIYATNPLERCFRDIHVATQHAEVAPIQYEAAGRVFLGLGAQSPLV